MAVTLRRFPGHRHEHSLINLNRTPINSMLTAKSPLGLIDLLVNHFLALDPFLTLKRNDLQR
jgi:hypothetical protein